MILNLIMSLDWVSLAFCHNAMVTQSTIILCWWMHMCYCITAFCTNSKITTMSNISWCSMLTWHYLLWVAMVKSLQHQVLPPQLFILPPPVDTRSWEFWNSEGQECCYIWLGLDRGPANCPLQLHTHIHTVWTEWNKHTRMCTKPLWQKKDL